MAMFDTLKKVLAPVGPSGRETLVAEVIRRELDGFVDSMETDALGNLICTKKGVAEEPKKIMLCAHMDHIGFVVNAAEKEGFLRVSKVGGISLKETYTRHVVFENGVHGVLGCEPVKGEHKFSNLYIDIGAADKAEALSMVSIGDMAVYAPDCYRLGQYRVASPAMDDRSACALLIELMKSLKDTKDTVVAVFTSQEEVGTRGAQVAAFALKPDIGIAIDVTATGDCPEEKTLEVFLGEGIAVKIMDQYSISHPGLRDALLAAGDKAGVKTQREVLPFGGTDAGAMQRSRGGIPVCTLSIPSRYIHSACEVVDLRDMEAGLKLLQAYLDQ